jgi:hypothetical protein
MALSCLNTVPLISCIRCGSFFWRVLYGWQVTLTLRIRFHVVLFDGYIVNASMELTK